MGRVLVVVLGFGIVLGAAWWYLRAHAVTQPSTPDDVTRPSVPGGPAQPSQAKATLDNVRGAANRIEAQGQQQADKAAEEPR